MRLAGAVIAGRPVAGVCSGAMHTSLRAHRRRCAPRPGAGTLVLPLVLLAACGGDPSTPEPTAPDASPPIAAAPRIPAPTGTCPAIVNGVVTFAPAGMSPRQVTLSLDPAAASADAPLVLYWHATGSGPPEAAYALGASAAALRQAGGIIAAPASDPVAGQFEWFIVNRSARQDDFVLADEIVGCLVAAQRVAPTRIHAMGMSAGALQTTALSFTRSAYIASVATYSGGIPDGFTPVIEEPDNRFAAMIFSGGAGDNVFGVDFQAASARYRTALADSGHFTITCDHGQGHQIPLDAAPSVLGFFDAHGFGVSPSPYAAGLPSTFPSYCER